MKFLYLSLLTTIIVSVVASFDRDITTIDAICALNKETSSALQQFDIPFGAQHKKEIVWRQEAPDDFGAVLALIQATSVAPCDFPNDQEAKVSIRTIRLIEQDVATGAEQTVSEVTNFASPSQTRLTGKLFDRLPRWYQPGGNIANPPLGMIDQDGDILTVDLSKAPRQIYHAWTEPQAVASPGKRYSVEMEVKIVGQARLQMGIDYWRTIGAPDNGWDSTCQKSNNCEGYLSDWFRPTEKQDWQTIRVPEAFK